MVGMTGGQSLMSFLYEYLVCSFSFIFLFLWRNRTGYAYFFIFVFSFFLQPVVLLKKLMVYFFKLIVYSLCFFANFSDCFLELILNFFHESLSFRNNAAFRVSLINICDIGLDVACIHDAADTLS